MPNRTPPADTALGPIDFDSLAREFKSTPPPSMQRAPTRYRVETRSDPPMEITRLTVPFEDVFFFAFKFFIAQVIIGLPIAVAFWLVVLR